jgi:hypothetical protein
MGRMGALLGFMAVMALGVGTLVTVVAGGRRHSLSAAQRRDLADACRTAGIAEDEVEELVRTENDQELMRRHRAAHRSRRGRIGPFR